MGMDDNKSQVPNFREKQCSNRERKALKKELVLHKELIDLNQTLKSKSDKFNRKENELCAHLERAKLENKSLTTKTIDLEAWIRELQAEISDLRENKITTLNSTYQIKLQPAHKNQVNKTHYENEEIDIREQSKIAAEQICTLTEDKEKLRKEFTASLQNNDDTLIKQVDELEAFVEYLEYRLEKISYEFDKLDFLERLMNQAGSNLW
ncbi:hypothetical protein NDA01_05420 [Trichocoleus desertorum AS-A10]|uniref:hypothetical protein n=1 Tax=Trichocoleus desertorum TaxID=1481672 RepID=UPI0032991CF6